jgi:hypothetical protein
MPGRKDAGTLLAPVAIAAIAIVCCAAPPVLAGALAGLTLAAVLGVGGGLIALIAVLSATVMYLRARRRRSCLPSDQRRRRED